VSTHALHDALPISAGEPRAFAIASFAAKRAAREAGGRSRSEAVNNRSRSAGTREREAMKRLTSTTSTPIPLITECTLHPLGRAGIARSVTNDSVDYAQTHVQ